MLLGLLLVILANFGLSVHSAHHSLESLHSGAVTLSLTGHTEPDPTCHLETATQVRILNCPGCLLHQEVGGSHLPDKGNLTQPVIATRPVEADLTFPTSRTTATQSPRGPPSC